MFSAQMVPRKIVDPACEYCLGFAKVPFAQCWYCGSKPSYHHGRCCPLKPRQPGAYLRFHCKHGLQSDVDLNRVHSARHSHACRNSSSLGVSQQVKAVRTALKTRFLNSEFTPVCLGFPWCDNTELEEHLQTVVGKVIGMVDKDEDRLWWYRTEIASCHSDREDVCPRHFRAVLHVFKLQWLRFQHVSRSVPRDNV